MSGVNITCSIGNQLGNGGGEMKFEVDPKENVTCLANCIATEIVNEILENALDIATMNGIPGIHCDTIAFSIDDGLCSFRNQKSNKFDDNMEELNRECPDIKDIIDGLSAIHITKTHMSNVEEPLRLDVEMKRLLNEMMSPPYDIVNYEALARKDGVGDQPIEDFPVRDTDDFNKTVDDCLVDVEKTKLVEKKTRVTDLVMNSKQALSEYLMSDESRKYQEEWEENNEKVIQVIEFDYIKADEKNLLKKNTDTETKEDEDREEYILPKDNESMDNVDLSVVKDEVGAADAKRDDGRGETLDKVQMAAGSSNSKRNSLDAATAKIICKKKFENLKKKKWSINFKFWGLGKRKSRDKEEGSMDVTQK